MPSCMSSEFDGKTDCEYVFESKDQSFWLFYLAFPSWLASLLCFVCFLIVYTRLYCSCRFSSRTFAVNASSVAWLILGVSDIYKRWWLTANCNIQILASSDYLTLSLAGTSHTIQFSDYTSLNMESWIQLLNNVFETDSLSITAINDNCGRVVLSATEEIALISTRCNIKQLIWLYSLPSESFPLVSELVDSTYLINVDSCSYFLSTPNRPNNRITLKQRVI